MRVLCSSLPMAVLLLLVLALTSAAALRPHRLSIRPHHRARPDLPANKPFPVNIDVNLDKPIATLPDTFLGVTMDAESLPNHWNYLNFSNPALQSLSQALAPNLLRFGGTAADRTFYNVTGHQQKHCKRVSSTDPNLYMSLEDFNQLTGFLSQAGWELVFGLNALTRNQDGSWNSDQAQQLINLVQSNPDKYPVHAFELGNEPDLYPRIYSTNVDPDQMVQDYIKLRAMIPSDIEFWGPDPAGYAGWYEQFMASLHKRSPNRRVIDATTLHQYYRNAINATVDDAIDPAVLQHLYNFVASVESIATQTSFKQPLSLGESSSFYGGGAAGISDRFCAGFVWLDKLGYVATRGWVHVFRQTFIGGNVPPFHLNYGLVTEDLVPNPDFFAAVLHKRLMGSQVLAVTQPITPQPLDQFSRVYAHCTTDRVSDSLPADLQRDGAVTLMVLNLHKTQNLSVNFVDWFNVTGQRVDFILTPHSHTGNYLTDMVAQVSELNGQPLYLSDDGSASMPSLAGKLVQDVNAPLLFPPLSYGFSVLLQAKASVCTQAQQQGKEGWVPVTME